jgi:hypothetical protein
MQEHIILIVKEDLTYLRKTIRFAVNRIDSIDADHRFKIVRSYAPGEVLISMEIMERKEEVSSGFFSFFRDPPVRESRVHEQVRRAISIYVDQYREDKAYVDLSCRDPRAAAHFEILLSDLEWWWKGNIVEHSRVELQPARSDDATEVESSAPSRPPPAQANAGEDIEQRAGTFERVAYAHQLITKEGMSRSKAFRKARTDPRTYDRWCEKATGEPPVQSYS